MKRLKTITFRVLLIGGGIWFGMAMVSAVNWFLSQTPTNG